MSWTTRPASEAAGDIAAQIKGAGPVLVLVHGVGLCAEAWTKAGNELSASMEVHAVDMPGHGLSPLNDASSLGDFSNRIAQYIENIRQPVRVAGHSMGAMIAIQLAARTSLDVTAVAALNAIYRRDPAAARAVRARAADLPDDRASDPEITLQRWFGALAQTSLAPSADACRRWLTQADPKGYKAAYTVFAHQDGPEDELLRGLSCPALFLTGGRDPNSTPAMSHAMADLCPDGAVDVLTDAAHMMPLTHAPETARRLATFFGKGGCDDTR